jgi:hypothetical protein
VHEGDHGDAVGEEDSTPECRGAEGVAHKHRSGAAHHEVAEVQDRVAGEFEHDGTEAKVHRERLSFLS